MEMFLDEYDVPLSELQKAMILKDTSGVAQKSSKASDAPIPGKSLTARTLFVSDTNIPESVLPPPPPSHKIFTIPNPIPQPPPTNITFLEPITDILPYPLTLSSPIPPPFKDVSAPYP